MNDERRYAHKRPRRCDASLVVDAEPERQLAVEDIEEVRVAPVDVEIGALAPGYRADLLVLDASPLASIRNTRRIVWVIKGGTSH